MNYIPYISKKNHPLQKPSAKVKSNNPEMNYS